MCSEVSFLKNRYKNKKITRVGGGRNLIDKHVWRSAPTWLHVLLFPAMYEHPRVKIVPTMSQSAHLLLLFFLVTGRYFLFILKQLYF